MNEEISDNPLLFASKELFRQTYRFSQTNELGDVERVSIALSKELDSFSNNTMEQGVDSRHLHIARYMLCTFCDELIANASWADHYDWGSVSLLNKYYQESYGGDKFFQLLQKMEQNPTEYIHLMELAFVCLSFDFGGRYKQLPDGLQELTEIKENLYRQIKTTRPQREKFYANHPSAKRHYKLYSKFSKRLILGTALILITIIYVVFTYTVHSNENMLIQVIEKEEQKIKDTNGTQL